jgi:hypothetical protein
MRWRSGLPRSSTSQNWRRIKPPPQPHFKRIPSGLVHRLGATDQFETTNGGVSLEMTMALAERRRQSAPLRNLPLIVNTTCGLGELATKLINDCSRRRRTGRTDPFLPPDCLKSGPSRTAIRPQPCQRVRADNALLRSTSARRSDQPARWRGLVPLPLRTRPRCSPGHPP